MGGCRLVAIEGTNGVGKTTVAHALTARLKAASVLANLCEESARANAFVEGFTLHGETLTMHAELQLFAATISDQILATRHSRLLVCDKTPASLLGYIGVLLSESLSPYDRRLLSGMRVLLWEWSRAYDLVFVLEDRFNIEGQGDGVRDRVTRVRWAVAEGICEALGNFESEVVPVPTGLTLERRIDWICGCIEERNITR